jgi:hypothetical protein
MTQFNAFDPNAEVKGTTILAIKTGVELVGGDPLPYLAKYGLIAVNPSGWYNLQAVLNMLQDIHLSDSNYYNLISIGSKIPEFAAWPPEINSVQQAFEMLDVAYHMNHRNGEIGCYRTEVVGPRHIRVTARNPWPSDFDYGLCWGLLRRFAPAQSRPTVVRASSPCRVKGDEECIYHVTW